MSAADELHNLTTAVWDQLCALEPATERLTTVAGLVGELRAEEFDAMTVNEAAAAVESVELAADAVRDAGVSPDALLAAIGGS